MNDKRLFCGRGAFCVSGQPGSRTLNLASWVHSQRVTFARFQLFPAEPDVHLSAHPALQKLVLCCAIAILSICYCTHCLASCTPSPCLRHYPEHLSTMGTPSPCVSRHVGDPQVTLYLRSVCRFPLRLFSPEGPVLMKALLTLLILHQ